MIVAVFQLAVTTGQARLGWVLIAIGLVCLVIGVLGMAKKVLMDTFSGVPGLGDVIGALAKSGPAGLMAALGLLLIVIGLALTGEKLW